MGGILPPMRFPFLLKCLAVLLALTAPTLWAGGSPLGGDAASGGKPASGIFLLAAGFDLGPETPKSQTASRILEIPGKKCGGGLDPVNRWDPSGLAAYFFDGTGNHPESTNLDGTDNFKTNVRYLFDAYLGDKFYAYGIGTGYDPAGGVYSQYTLSEGIGIKRQSSELATGQTMHERVNWMMQRLEGQLAKGDKNVEVFGFSRGGASALEFLNRIKDKVSEGDPKYQGINVRFVGLFDVVSSMRESTLGGESNKIVPRTIPGLASLSDPWLFWQTDPDGKRRQYQAVQYRFSLPQGLNYTSPPIHAVAMDEQRKEFQVTDVQGSLQVGFRGVHSDVGGGYGPGNAFEWQPRMFMLQRAQAAGLEFDPLKLAKWPQSPQNASLWWASRNPKLQSTVTPTDNSDWKFNDNEPRVMPRGMISYQGGQWYSSPLKNAWMAPAFPFQGGGLPSISAMQARNVLGVEP